MANDINLKYTVRAEVLTPLSIGQGLEKDWVEGIDFIVKDKTLYHLDMSRMVAAGVDINRLSSCFVSGKAQDVASLIGSKLEQVSDFQMKMPCATDNPIKTFLRNQLTNRPVLAGSSLKGAIRSVLFAHLRTNERTNEEVFGSLKEGTDFMRFVRVGDMEFDNTRLVNTKIFNLHIDEETQEWEAGWKKATDKTTNGLYPTAFNTIYECLLDGQSALGNISISETLFKNLLAFIDSPHNTKHITMPKRDEKEALFIHEVEEDGDIYETSPLEELFYIINCHTKDYLRKELKFFRRFDEVDESEYVIESINHLLVQVQECLDDGNQSCVLKMSAGVGFHSITGDWQYSDYVKGTLDMKRNRDAMPKSRKIATYGDHFDLMGFVKLTIE